MSTIDFSRRFSGIDRLFGPGTSIGFAAAHICVIGIGGVGSWSVEALARSGVGQITLIDLDHVAESNINRQIHATESTLGKAKVLAMRDRVSEIFPACIVTPIEAFIDPENIGTIIPPCHVIIDAIDQVRAKVALIAYCRNNGISLVTTGAAGGKTEPTQIRVDDLSRTTQDPLASRVRAQLRKNHGFPRDPKHRFGIPCVYSLEPVQRSASCPETHSRGLNCAGFGSVVTVTGAFGFAAACAALKQLRTR